MSCEPNGTGVKSQLNSIGNNLSVAASGKEVSKQLPSLVFRTNNRERALKVSLKAQGERRRESDEDTE